MNPDDPNATTSRVLTTFLPLMIGFFSLNVPSGLSLYYFSNTALMMLVMVVWGSVNMHAAVDLSSFQCACRFLL